MNCSLWDTFSTTKIQYQRGDISYLHPSEVCTRTFMKLASRVVTPIQAGTFHLDTRRGNRTDLNLLGLTWKHIQHKRQERNMYPKGTNNQLHGLCCQIAHEQHTGPSLNGRWSIACEYIAHALRSSSDLVASENASAIDPFTNFECNVHRPLERHAYQS